MATFLSPGPGGDDFGVFGARQAVLVRSAAARQRLALEQPWLTNMGATILTVEESKGLEFDDVFLFDFFRDSECGSEWVVVADAAVKRWGFIPENMRGTDASMDAAIARYRRCQRHCAELNPRIHGRLLRELQLLYVALSRGRRRLFIFDTDADKRALMFTFLASPVAVPDTDTAGPPVALFSHEAHTEQLDDYDVIDATTAPGAQTAAAAGAATARPAAVLLSASSASEWQTQGAELLRRADDAAAAAPARARALRLRAVRAYAAGHAAADALAAARLAGDAQLLAALEGRSQA
jgi:ATP-dependent exoDNAse (exonuclease V) beta subunit